MSTSNHDKYLQLRDRLVQCPEYMGVPTKNRKNCATFASLAAKLGTKHPPDASELDSAYGPALAEARKLLADGLLTLELPDNVDEPTSEGADDGSVTLSQEPKDEGLSPSTESEGNQHSDPTDNGPPEKYGVHPAANIFPMMSPDALSELAGDIKENGLQQAIVIHDGMVIDGRNRLEACKQAGIEPTYIEWKGKGSVVAWILSVNLHRRHLTDQQRAMIAGRVAREFASEAKERSVQNLRKNKDAVDESNQSTPGLGRSTERAATLLNVTSSAAKKAAKVLKSGDEQLTKAVDTGKVSIDAAAQLASLPKEKQRKILEKGKVVEAAKAIRKEKTAASSKGKSKIVDNTDKAQDPVPVTAKEVSLPSAAPEPPAKPVEKLKPVEGPVPESELQPEFDDPALVREAHEALNEMILAGQRAGKNGQVVSILGKMINSCAKLKAGFDEEATS